MKNIIFRYSEITYYRDYSADFKTAGVYHMSSMPDNESVRLYEVKEINGQLYFLFARNYLTGQLVAGRILTEAIQRTEEEQAVILHGQYACNEMIGLFREEEIIKPDGTNN